MESSSPALCDGRDRPDECPADGRTFSRTECRWRAPFALGFLQRVGPSAAAVARSDRRLGRRRSGGVARRRNPIRASPLHQRPPHHSPFVLVMVLGGIRRMRSILYKTAEDRGQPVSRRSEPISRNFLGGEQPHPWHRLQHQDKLRRHRGDKQLRR